MSFCLVHDVWWRKGNCAWLWNFDCIIPKSENLKNSLFSWKCFSPILYHWNPICFIFIPKWFQCFHRYFFASNYHDVLTYFPCQILRWKTLQTVTLIFQDLSANWTWMWCAHDYLNEHLQNKINCVWRRLKFTENFHRYTFRFEEDEKYISLPACLFK